MTKIFGFFILVAALIVEPLSAQTIVVRRKVFAAGGGGSFAVVQAKPYASSANATSHTLTFDTTPTVGNFQVVVAVCDTTAGTTPSGWSLDASAVDFTGTYVYSRVVPSSPTATFVLPITSSAGCVLWGTELAGMASSSVLDKTATAIGQDGPISTGTTAATAQANEWIVVVAGISAAGGQATVTAWNNSFVQAYAGATTPAAVYMSVATKSVTATGTQTASATLSGPDANASGIICTYKKGS